MFLILLFFSFSQLFAQDGPKVAEPILVDEFGSLGHCDFTGRIDAFLTELSQREDHHGYILTYKSVDELPGDRNSYPVERWIANHISYRNFDLSRITFVRSGYSTERRTQLWLRPPGADEPRASGVVPAPTISLAKTFLFANKALASDAFEIGPEMGMGVDPEPLPEFVLESVKARELAEQAELEKITQDQVEAPPATDESTSAVTELAETPDQSGAEDTIEEPVDTRTEAEREAARFQWADVSIAELISSRKASRGVIIFYADDERYDIPKLREFVKQGRDGMARTQDIAPSRLKIVFGGYRNEPTVELWFVPARGKTPRPTPSERPVEPPEESEEN